jgi:hypothetical protein
MSAPKSLVEVAQSLGLSADSVQSALSAEILKFVSTVDAQEANLRRSAAHDPFYSSHTATWPHTISPLPLSSIPHIDDLTSYFFPTSLPQMSLLNDMYVSVKSDAVDRMRAVVQGLWPRAQVPSPSTHPFSTVLY